MLQIHLKMTQCDTISRLLKESDDPKSELHVDTERLLQRIVSEAMVDKEVAEAYVLSHKHCSSTGTIGAMHKAVAAANPIATPIKAKDTGGAAAIEGVGKVAAILRLHEAGHSNDQIIAAGYNKSTVYRQVSEYKKRKKLQA